MPDNPAQILIKIKAVIGVSVPDLRPGGATQRWYNFPYEQFHSSPDKKDGSKATLFRILSIEKCSRGIYGF
ncbi:MAG: hypothetical protein LC127_16760 [Chitinophagales bacterium]|nr:hypothetical protein [Chitinophagales bacterium]